MSYTVIRLELHCNQALVVFHKKPADSKTDKYICNIITDKEK
ncbi:hypothetical protein HMPREF0971_02505 [Segatella oris F0302]|uniref:Uncharacterized protein n=1 Tax=Segatella oris F0302 TaxID=649760 RepID=D1QU23_9BACT|nr:hypothetical protein HMPREF0971_02505 [Segatella oris F0302]